LRITGKKPPEAVTWQIQIESDMPHDGAGLATHETGGGHPKARCHSVALNGF